MQNKSNILITDIEVMGYNEETKIVVCKTTNEIFTVRLDEILKAINSETNEVANYLYDIDSNSFKVTEVEQDEYSKDNEIAHIRYLAQTAASVASSNNVDAINYIVNAIYGICDKLDKVD